MTFYYVLLFGKLLQKLVFGDLRMIEVEHLYEQSWFSIMDTCLALTIFRDGFDLLFIIRFGFLLFCKTFHWITADRVDFMEQSNDSSVTFHLKMVSMMVVLLLVDLGMFMSAVNHTLSFGATMLIVFGFEVSFVNQYALLLVSLLSTSIKYTLHTIDMHNQLQNKSIYFFYTDILNDFLKLLSYLVFFGIVVHYYGIPIHILRDVYMTLRSFLTKVRDLKRYREATRDMHSRYPTATMEILQQTDCICIVCREEMVLPVAQQQEEPKVLPCGHVFHFRCLRSWLERQQACPTCRRSVLEQVEGQQQPEGPVLDRNAPQPQPMLGDNGQQQQPMVGGNAPLGQQPQAPHVQRGQPQVVEPIGHGHNPQLLYPIILTPIPTPSDSLPEDVNLLSDAEVRAFEGRTRQRVLKRVEGLKVLERKLGRLVCEFENLLGTFPEDTDVTSAAASNEASREDAIE